uniref:Uncharacterized protein n=1 Tax=Oryza sativa subsp. japonica TaxID=39947 RepID=Q2R426_ORYSJ|nr:hypothetical protein LOC_Os11g29930 [Oryza sativa Japonica Group]
MGHATHNGDAGVARDGRVRYEEGGDEAHEAPRGRGAAGGRGGEARGRRRSDYQRRRSSVRAAADDAESGFVDPAAATVAADYVDVDLGILGGGMNYIS